MRRKVLAAMLGCLLVPLGYVIGTPGVASAGTVTDHFLCQANAGSFGVQNADQDLTFVTSSPATVLQGQQAAFTVTMGNVVVPTSESGVTVNNVHNIFILLPDPSNAFYVSSFLTGATSGWTLTHGGGVLNLSYPGSVSGGSTLSPPTVNVTYQASGPALSVIALRPGGNPPYNETPGGNPSFGLTANVQIAGDVPTTCVADGSPPPAIASTTIVPSDTTPPVITIATPAAGAIYAQGSVVLAAYSCDDGPYGSGVATCAGPVASGAAIDTSTAGSHSFTVTSTDNDHTGTSTLTHNYTVISAPGISVSGGTVVEGPGAHVNFKVSLSRPPTATATLQYTTQDGSATAGSDYTATSGSLSFPTSGPYTATVSVPVVNDSVFEPTENFTLQLSNPTNAAFVNTFATGRIIDDDSPNVSVTGGTATKGTDNSITFTVALSDHAFHPVTVDYTTLDGNATAPLDYTATSGALTFNPDDALTKTVSISVGNSPFSEYDRATFSLKATVPASAQSATGTGEILDPANLPTVSISDATVGEGSGGKSNPTKLDISLDKTTSSPVVVRYQTVDGTAKAPGDYKAIAGPKSVVIPAGKTLKAISVSVVGDNVAEGNEQFGVQLVSTTGALLGHAVGTVTIVDDDPATSPKLSVGNASVYQSFGGGKMKVTVPISLSEPAPAPVTLTYATANGTATAPTSYTALTKTVTIKTGKSSIAASITIPTSPQPSGSKQFTLAITNASGASIATSTGTVTIIGNGAGSTAPDPPQSLVANPSTTALDTVNLSWSAPANDGGRAITGYDYQLSTDHGNTFGPWISTGAIDTSILAPCSSPSCTFSVRANNALGHGDGSDTVTAAGSTDTVAPAPVLERAGRERQHRHDEHHNLLRRLRRGVG